MEKRNSEKGRSGLTVKMFGKFQIGNEDGILNKENMRSEMLTRLLAYMVSHREKDMTAQDMIDVLWPDDKSDNPAGALKNLMYRLRKLMVHTWGEDGKYIVTGRGTYRLNPELDFHVDIEEFEECCRQVFNSKDSAVQQENGKRAVELYQGMFLSELSSEYWVVSIATYYHSIYLTMVKRLAALLEKEKLFTDAEEICGKAIQIEALDEELHCLLLRAMIADNKQKLAIDHYKETVKLLYDSLGVKPSQEMEAIYEELQKIQHDHESDIDIIQKELREEKVQGAFFCEYGVFRKIYILESRSSRRMGISVHLALVSLYLDLQVKKDRQDYASLIGEGMSLLKKTLMRGLRSSDIVCRYSVNQFLVMLPACQYEDAKMVVNRLKDSFYRSGKNSKLLLQYSIDELDVD